MTKTLTQADLAHFTGTEEWHRDRLTGLLYTDGVKYVADVGEAYWLLTDILTVAKLEPKVARQDFQHWVLKVDTDAKKGELVCDDGDGNVVYNQKIDYTDFPLPEIRFYLTGGVLLLPSEY